MFFFVVGGGDVTWGHCSRLSDTGRESVCVCVSVPQNTVLVMGKVRGVLDG